MAKRSAVAVRIPDTLQHLAVDITTLQPWPQNPRKGDLDAIRESLRVNGQFRPIVVRKADNTILAGNHTYFAAQAESWPEIAVTFVEPKDEAHAKRIVLADNRTAALGTFDEEILADLLESLDGVIEGTGYDQAALDELLASLGTGGCAPIEDVEPQIDRAEELRVQYGVELGQLWQLGTHRLLCGDSTDAACVAALLGGVHPPTLVFDPPYDADPALLALRWPCTDALVFTDHRHTLECITGWPAFRCLFAWDGVTSWYTPSWPLARGKFCLWFGGSAYNPDGSHYGEPDTAHTVSNTRGTYDYHPDPRGKHLSTVFQSPATRQFDGHAHAKPTAWVRMLVANCSVREVFDPFAGSGTTLVACEQLGRTCHALERDPGTVAVILQRMADLGLTPVLVRSTDRDTDATSTASRPRGSGKSRSPSETRRFA